MAATAHGADAVFATPDGRTRLRVAVDGTTFRVVRRDETLIAASPLGLELDGAPALGALKLASRPRGLAASCEDVTVDRKITLVGAQ